MFFFSEVTRLLRIQISARVDRLREATRSDLGASVVETVVIAAGLAALALSVMAGIKMLVDGKLSEITL